MFSNIRVKSNVLVGYKLPKDCTWNIKLVNGKKEGETTVINNRGIIVASLIFKNDMLNGLCVFFENGVVNRKITYVNDIADGWSCEIDADNNYKYYMYQNGAKRSILKRSSKLQGYWEERDLETDVRLSYFTLNDNYEKHGKAYIFNNQYIHKIIIYASGTVESCPKVFERGVMNEYADNGQLIYTGEYLESISLDYPRDGLGEEREYDKCIYKGHFKQGKRCGFGSSYRNGYAHYTGEWNNNLPNGTGRLYNRGGLVCAGDWVDGKLMLNDGRVISYDDSFRLSYKRHYASTSDHFVAIDFGTCNTSIAIWGQNGVEVIANDYGDFKTPSYISFTDGDCLFGKTAMNQSRVNPNNTIYGINRLFNCKFNDPYIQNSMKHRSFALKANKEGNPLVVITNEGKENFLSPEELASMILNTMKGMVENHFHEEIESAVITIPFAYNYYHRRCIYKACKLAGFKNILLLNASTSVAISYGLSKRSGEKNVLVFDLGGCYCNVSLVSIDDGIVEVKAIAGDNHLGGDYFDNRLVEYFCQEFKCRFNKDLTTSQHALCRLRFACERAKRTLSSSTIAYIEISSLFEGIDFYSQITRARFEELNSDYFRRALIPVEKVLRDANISKNQVYEIILAGGSSHIPKVQAQLKQFFNGRNLSICPETTIYGAMSFAACKSGEGAGSKLDNLLLLDVTPYPIGLETNGGVMTIIVNRNTTIPIRKMRVLSTNSDNQTKITLKVFEGEHSMTRDNVFIGSITLDGIPLMPRGVPRIEVTFDFDADCILSVTAEEKSTGKKQQVTFSYDYEVNQDPRSDDGSFIFV